MLSNEKIEDYKKHLITVLLEVLTKLNELENEYYIKEMEFNNSYPGNSIPDELVEVGRSIWKEYNEKLRTILREYCTEKVSEDKYSGYSLGSPTKYYFIEKEYNLQFIMKTEKKALIEINYEEWKGSCFGKQFTFSPTEKGWKISCVKDRMDKDESWSRSWM